MTRFTKILAVALLASSTVSFLPGIAQASTVVKAKANHSWSPSAVSISQNGKVIWKNPTGVNHTVTATSSNWNKNVTLNPGEQTSFTFRHSGTFRYKCNIHSGMTGKVTVN